MTRTVVGIDGMACSMCESHVNDIVRRNFHVKSVKASHKKKQAEIISAEPLDEAALRKAIGDGCAHGAVQEKGPVWSLSLPTQINPLWILFDPQWEPTIHSRRAKTRLHG